MKVCVVGFGSIEVVEGWWRSEVEKTRWVGCVIWARFAFLARADVSDLVCNTIVGTELSDA